MYARSIADPLSRLTGRVARQVTIGALVAAIAAAALIAPAAAAPAASPLAPTDGIVHAKPPIPQPVKPEPKPNPGLVNTDVKIPVGDISVSFLKSEIANPELCQTTAPRCDMKYSFRFRNDGPKPMKFDARFEHVMKNYAYSSPDIVKAGTYPDQTLGVGETVDLVAWCQPPQHHYCHRMTATVANIRGIDPNHSNNTATGY